MKEGSQQVLKKGGIWSRGSFSFGGGPSHHYTKTTNEGSTFDSFWEFIFGQKKGKFGYLLLDSPATTSWSMEWLTILDLGDHPIPRVIQSVCLLEPPEQQMSSSNSFPLNPKGNRSEHS